jgi:hypothetical protein
MEAAAIGIHYRSETIQANGYVSHSEYLASYDGREVIVTGSHGLLTPVSLKRLSSNVVVASYVSGLQSVANSRRVVSNDGRMMTITTTSLDQARKVVTNVGVYEKISPETP